MIAAWGASEDGLMREYKEIRRTRRRKKRNANEVDRSGLARVFDYYHALVADRLSKHRTNIHTPLELISSTNSAPYVAIPFGFPARMLSLSRRSQTWRAHGYTIRYFRFVHKPRASIGAAKNIHKTEDALPIRPADSAS